MNKHSGKSHYIQGAAAEKAEPPKRNFFPIIFQQYIFSEGLSVLKEV